MFAQRTEGPITDVLIDVLLPVRDAAATISATLESLTQQTEKRFRVVLIDDGSSDGTFDLVTGFDGRLSMTIVRLGGVGVANALNEGLKICRAPYVARVDGDDIYYPNRFERQLEFLEKNKEVVALGCDVDHINGAGNALFGLPKPVSPDFADVDWVPAREPYIVHPFLFVRREALQQVGGYRDFATSQDSDLYWRLRRVGRLHNLPEKLGAYRFHNTSVSDRSLRNGRIMAVCSQLAALSARRVQAGHSDVVIPSHTLFAQSESLEDMLATFEPLLSSRDFRTFRWSVSGKLLELARYRSYELAPEDCRTIAASLRKAKSLPKQNQRELRWYRSVTAARLLSQGRLACAWTLAPWGAFVVAWCRCLINVTGLSSRRMQCWLA